jgi:hypothetical protein
MSLSDTRVRAVVAESVPSDVRVDVFPNGVCTDPQVANYFHSFALPGRWVLHVREGLDPETLGHEFGHAGLCYEHYPTLVCAFALRATVREM